MVVGVHKAIESALDGVSPASGIQPIMALLILAATEKGRRIMDTRDPLKVGCPKCGAKAGQFCSTRGTICSLHEERKGLRTQQRGIRKVSVLASVRASN